MNNITVNHNIMMQSIYAGGPNIMLSQPPINGFFAGHVLPGMTPYFQPTTAQHLSLHQTRSYSPCNVKREADAMGATWTTMPTVDSPPSRHERIVLKTEPLTQKKSQESNQGHVDWDSRPDAHVKSDCRYAPVTSHCQISEQTKTPPHREPHDDSLARTSASSNRHAFGDYVVTTPLRQLCLPAIKTSSNVAGNVMMDEFDLGYYSFSDCASLADSIDEINCQPLSDDDDVTGFSDIIEDVFGSFGNKHATVEVSKDPHPAQFSNSVSTMRAALQHQGGYQCQDSAAPLTFNRQDEKNSQSPLYCTLCDKYFQSRTGLKAHVKLHKGERPHVCGICGKGFSQKSTLRTHVRTHTGEKPYACTYCERSFGDYSTFRKHLRTHTGEKPYTCDVCHKSFTQSGNMIRHREIHSRGERKRTVSV